MPKNENAPFTENIGFVPALIQITRIVISTAGIAVSQRICGNVVGHDTAGTNDTVVSNGNTGQHLYTAAEPNVIAHPNGFCCLQAGSAGFGI